MKLFYTGLGLLLLFQLTTGFLITNKKTGFSAERIYEYFAGSESAVSKFENWKDRFIPQKTFRTVTKTAILHISMIGIFIFTTLHIAIINSKGKLFLFLISILASVAAFVNFIAPYFIIKFIFPVAYIKLFSLVCFYSLTTLLVILAFRIKNKNFQNENYHSSNRISQEV